MDMLKNTVILNDGKVGSTDMVPIAILLHETR